MTWTDPQIQAIRTDAPIVSIRAGAGAGKTRILVERTIRLREQGVPASRILGVTFTRAAATEWLERLAARDRRLAQGLHVSTIHSWCSRLLRAVPGVVGRSEDYSIYDEVDVGDIQARILADGVVAGVTQRTWRAATSTARLKDPKEIEARREQATKLERELDRRLRSWDALGYDDLLTGAWVTLLESSEARARHRYDHILVDEAQDTAPIPWQMFGLLKPEVLCIVGDTRQSIYSWLHARPERIAALEAEKGAVRIDLAHNFRSTPPIVELANRVAHGMGEDHADMQAVREGGRAPALAPFADRYERAAHVAHEIERHLALDGEPSDVAVLAREWRSLEPVAEALEARSIPYHMPREQEDLWKREGPRLLIHILRCALNRRDGWAAERVLHEVCGTQAARQAIARALRAGRDLRDADEVVARALDRVREVAGYADEAMLRADVGLSIGVSSATTGRETKAAEVLDARRIVAELVDAGTVSTAQDLLDWITHRDLSERVAEGADKTILSTIHGAKGREWPVVYLLDWRPRGGDYEEERRLAYVGATRARDELHWYWHGDPGPFVPVRLAPE